MRSFSSLLLLLALSLPFFAMADRRSRRPRTGHGAEPALHARARDHVLHKRISNARITYYDIGGAQVACGGYYQPSDFVVALNGAQFGDVYPGPYCGKYITITAFGKTATAEVVDKCPGCPYGGLDLTKGLFAHFTDIGAGVISADWDWVDGSPSKTTTTSHTTQHSTTSSSSSSSSSSTSTSTTPKSHTSTRTYSLSTTSSTSRSPPYTTGAPSINGTMDGLAQPVGTINGQSLGNLYHMNEVILGFALIAKSFDT
ncbi:RlpA-like double-psi beta-barrel-protein domain-containing protein-containing protein [Russula brevipes]|nr:RlpA-like double-psi beta-barrel-protein domain-containing protein-containing protein [Russula brevipes]